MSQILFNLALDDSFSSAMFGLFDLFTNESMQILSIELEILKKETKIEKIAYSALLLAMCRTKKQNALEN
jgi:hypothetical protein